MTDRSDRRTSGATPDDGRVDGLAEQVTRYGWLAKGFVFVMIGLLAAQLARQGYGTDADQSGALLTVASEAPAGRWLVGVVGAGLLLFAGWELWSAFRRSDGGALQALKRVGWVGLAAVYGMLGVTGLQIALHGPVQSGASDEGGPTSPTGITQWLFDAPGGRFVVAAIGLVTFVVGGYHLWKGVRLEFLDDIDTDDLSRRQRTALGTLGVAGFVARSLLLFVTGYLFVVAAWTYEADEAAGIDEALRTLASAPLGRAVLAASAVGLVAAGLYDMVTFRRQRLTDDA